MNMVLVGFAIACVIAVIFLFAEGKAKESNIKKANENEPMRVTVKKVMPKQDGSANVIFETEYGLRLNLEVPNCTILEGETGMLREYMHTFSSFTRDS